MSNMVDYGRVPWPALNDYLLEIGASQSREEFLERVVRGLHRLVPCDVEAGFFQINGPYLYSLFASEKRQKEYVTYYQYRIPFPSDSFQDGPSGFLGVRKTNWRAPRYRGSEFVNGFILPQGVEKTVLATLPDSRHAIAIHRSRSEPDFNDRECAILRVLSPHIGHFYGCLEKMRAASRSCPSTGMISESFPALSKREAEVAALLCRGNSAAEMATRLFVGRRTIETHLANLYSKLGVRGRVGARQALLDLDEREAASPRDRSSPRRLPRHENQYRA